MRMMMMMIKKRRVGKRGITCGLEKQGGWCVELGMECCRGEGRKLRMRVDDMRRVG